MYVRWQGRKRHSPAFGGWHGVVLDEIGEPVRNERRTPLTTRRRADGSVGQDVRWTAVVVESVRINGKPRQRHIAQIASITESANEIVSQPVIFGTRCMSGSTSWAIVCRLMTDGASRRPSPARCPGFHAKSTTPASRPRLPTGYPSKSPTALRRDLSAHRAANLATSLDSIVELLQPRYKSATLGFPLGDFVK